jgi:uncharacterized protein (TIGR02217 family)
MAHLNNVRLPEDIAVGAVYGPEFVTEIVQMQSGREKRNQVRRKSLCVGDLSFAPRLAEDYPELLKFFRGVNGRFNSYRFKDYTDFECALTEGVVAAIDSTHFQLQKKYATGSLYELRDIQQPIASGLVLKYSGSTLTVTTDYTLDDATGIITISGTHVAGNFTWSGEFDNAVRFDTDKLPTRIDGYRVFTAEGIPIKEVRL